MSRRGLSQVFPPPLPQDGFEVLSLFGAHAGSPFDWIGHLFGDRLDIVADAMAAARTSALAGGYPVGTGGEVVELRRDAK
jgi:hypothetical protein